MAPRFSCPNRNDIELVNLNVFYALPFIIAGGCINECIRLGRQAHVVGIVIAVLTLICCSSAALRIWRPRTFITIMLVIGISTLAALGFAVITVGENVVPVPDMVYRNRSDVNGTSCFESSSNNSTSEECYASWNHDVKSSFTLFTSNVILGINTFLIQPVSLPS